MLIVWAVERWLTFIAVNAFGIVLAILADTTSIINSMNIQRLLKQINFWIVNTFGSMVKAITF